MKWILKRFEESTPPQFIKRINRFGRWLLPFVSPHRFKVLSISDIECLTEIPYIPNNLNHLEAIHGGAITTLGDFTAGILMLWNFGMTQYRLILSKIEVDYHTQASTSLRARTSFTSAEKESTQKKLNQQEKVTLELLTKIEDLEKNEIATVKTWIQIKPWKTIQKNPPSSKKE